MKKIIYKLTVLFIIVLLNTSCDHVKDVRDPNVTVVTGNRNILVEDYTGHKCGNCPAAADTLRYLEHTYGGKIIPLAIHAGFFASVNSSYPLDLRTSSGNDYDAQFGISAAGNPNGLINRIGYGTGGFIKAYSTWESEVVQMFNKAAKFEIKINNNYIASSQNLSTKITVKSLTNNSGKYKLVVLLTEDSIIGKQIDYRLPSGNQDIPDYEFNHVLRDAINSTWGDAVFSSGAVTNDSIVKPYNYIINTNYNAAKCHVVAYIYDADSSSPTYYEVFQAEQKKVK